MRKFIIGSIIGVLFNFLLIVGLLYIHKNDINKNGNDNGYSYCIISMQTKVALDPFFKKVTGYDSVQLVCDYNGDSLWLNFCYPNKWEFDKFKKLANESIDTNLVLKFHSTNEH